MIATAKPHILIAGAGIGGLVLAQCLRKNNLAFTVFERDPSPTARSQGWAIALHTILEDLLAAMPDDMPNIETVSHLNPLTDRQAQLCFYDTRHKKEGMQFMVQSKPLEEVGYGPGRVIRANRDRLRDWLSTNINIQWGKQVASFNETDQGVTVQFTDDTTAEGTLLVGADGIKSAVRANLIPSAKLQTVPMCFLTGEVTLTKSQYVRQMALGISSYAVLSTDFHIFVGLNRVSADAQSAEYYWDLVYDDATRSGAHWIDSASPKDLYDLARSKTAHLDPKFTEIISLTDPSCMMTPPLILRDLILESMPVGRVTLLGDAAHAMVPFQGEGGCHAIDDALKLARILIEAKDVDGVDLAGYQKEMLARGASAVRASRSAGDSGDGTQTDERKAWGLKVVMVHD